MSWTLHIVDSGVAVHLCRYDVESRDHLVATVLFPCVFSYRQRLADCLGMVAMHVTVVVMVMLDLLLLTTLLLIDQDVICGMSHIRHHPNVRTSMYAQSAAVLI